MITAFLLTQLCEATLAINSADFQTLFGGQSEHLWQRFSRHNYDLLTFFPTLDSKNRQQLLQWLNSYCLRNNPGDPACT
jgi:hypothetical protein